VQATGRATLVVVAPSTPVALPEAASEGQRLPLLPREAAPERIELHHLRIGWASSRTFRLQLPLSAALRLHAPADVLRDLNLG
jgi:hypothetical protein